MSITITITSCGDEYYQDYVSEFLHTYISEEQQKDGKFMLEVVKASQR